MSTSNSPTGLPPAQLCDRVICWFDVLGVRQGLENAHSAGTETAWVTSYAADLKLIHDSLAAQYTGSGFDWNAVSDAVVLSVPLILNHPEFTTGFIFMDAAEAQYRLALSGRFMRGAITIGPLLVDGTVIVGSGLVDAQKLEACKASFPRILIGDPILKLLPTFVSYYGGSANAPQGLHLAVDADDQCFVNYLYTAIEHADGDVAAAVAGLQAHKLQVEQQLKAYSGCNKIHSKYIWTAQYHNWFCQNFLPHASSSALQIVNITSRCFYRL
jgi:hypothetical protein